MKLGLAAIDSLCLRLDRPEARVPSVLIAGTNGKGSTAATLSAIAAAAGLRAGLYTSPHLVHVTERVRIDERDVSEGELDEALGRVFRAAEGAPEIPATYFEALTAAAFSTRPTWLARSSRSSLRSPWITPKTSVRRSPRSLERRRESFAEASPRSSRALSKRLSGVSVTPPPRAEPSSTRCAPR
jgi:hypothetical protein